MPSDITYVAKKPHRKRNQLLSDRAIIAKMYTRGVPILQITEQINAMFAEEGRGYTLSDSTVWKEIKAIQTAWKESYMLDFDQHVSRELAHVDELERAYWIEWEESRKERNLIQTERVTDKNTNKTGEVSSSWSREKVTAAKQKREGNADFLKGVQWCINKRCGLLGLDAPKTVNVTWRDDARKAGVDPDIYSNSLYEQFIKAAVTEDEKPKVE